MTPLEIIVQQLPKLTTAELLDVRSRAGAMAQFTDKGVGHQPFEPATNDDADIVLDALVSVLKAKGVEFASAVMLRKMPTFPAFRAKVPGVMDYLRTCVSEKNKLRVLLNLAVDLLYADMGRMGVVISARTMMNHIHRVPAVLNRNFPGYAQAGLLGMIVGERPDVRQQSSDVPLSRSGG